MYSKRFAALQSGGWLRTFQRHGGHVLIPLDGTQYFCSQKVSCDNCSSRTPANGKCEYYRAMVAARAAVGARKLSLRTCAR